MLNRRLFLGSVGALAAAAATGCAAGGVPTSAVTPGASGTPTSGTLRVAYFASEVRAKAFEAGIAVFTKSHPGISVSTEHTPVSNYFDKLATQFAAGDAADVVMMSEVFLGDYVKRRALREIAIDTSGLDPAAASAGVFDGKLYGVAGGVNTMTLLANVEAFERLGVALPDDKTWTWDEYASVSATISQKSGGAVIGSSLPNPGSCIEMWLRQSGQSLFTKDGKVGFEVSALAPLLAFLAEMERASGLPQASVVVEQNTSLELSGLSTNKTALGWAFSGQQAVIERASGAKLRMLRPPSQNGASAQSFAYLKPDSLWSVNGRSQSADLAAYFVQQMVADPSIQAAIGSLGGVPSSLAARAAVKAEVNAVDRQTFDYVDAMKSEFDAERSPRPAGASAIDTQSFEMFTEVLFARKTPEQAAQRFRDDLDSELG